MVPNFDKLFSDMDKMMKDLDKQLSSLGQARNNVYSTKYTTFTSTQPVIKKPCTKCGYDTHSVQYVKIDDKRDCLLLTCQACSSPETTRTQDNPGKFDLPTVEEAQSKLKPKKHDKNSKEFIKMVHDTGFYWANYQKNSDQAKKIYKEIEIYLPQQKIQSQIQKARSTSHDQGYRKPAKVVRPS